MDIKELEDELNKMGLLVRKLEEWAESRPDKTFFYYGEEDRHLTYREFNQLANRMAHNLKEMGVNKGDRVSLFLHNPLITILSMFGLWKIGAVFCPINFLYKGRLLSYQISDTNPNLLMTENGCEPILNQIKSEIAGLPIIIHRPKKGEHGFRQENSGLKLDHDFNQTSFDDLLEGDDSNPETELHYWDTANIVYTSGTTGPPKGVIQSYRWLQNYCYYGVELLHPDDVVYCDLPLYHIGGAFSLVGRASWRGCTVAVWDRFSASDFWNRIKASQASYTLLLDVMMPWLLQPEERPEDRFNTLRRAHMQPLPEYHHRFAKRFGIDFVNVVGYGCAAMINETVDGEGTPKEFCKGFTRNEIIQVAHRLGMPVVPGNAGIRKGFMGKACMQHEVTILNEHDEELGIHIQEKFQKRYFFDPGSTKGVMVTPATDPMFIPQGLVIYGNPSQIGKIAKGIAWYRGESVYGTAGGFGCCIVAASAAIRHKIPKVVIPAAGEKILGHCEGNEVLIALPVKDLPEIVAGMEATDFILPYPTAKYLMFEPTRVPKGYPIDLLSHKTYKAWREEKEKALNVPGLYSSLDTP